MVITIGDSKQSFIVSQCALFISFFNSRPPSPCRSRVSVWLSTLVSSDHQCFHPVHSKLWRYVSQFILLSKVPFSNCCFRIPCSSYFPPNFTSFPLTSRYLSVISCTRLSSICFRHVALSLTVIRYIL